MLKFLSLATAMLVFLAACGGSKAPSGPALKIEPLSGEAWSQRFCQIEAARYRVINGNDGVDAKTLALSDRIARAQRLAKVDIEASNTAQQDLKGLASETPADARTYLESWTADVVRVGETFSSNLARLASVTAPADFDAFNREISSVMETPQTNSRTPLSDDIATVLHRLSGKGECGAIGRQVSLPVVPLTVSLLPAPFSGACAACGLKWSASLTSLVGGKAVVKLDVENTGERGQIDLTSIRPNLRVFNQSQADTLRTNWPAQNISGVPGSDRQRTAGYATVSLATVDPLLKRALAVGETASGTLETNDRAVGIEASALIVELSPVSTTIEINGQKLVAAYSSDFDHPALTLTGTALELPPVKGITTGSLDGVKFNYDTGVPPAAVREVDAAVLTAREFGLQTVGASAPAFDVRVYEDLDSLIAAMLVRGRRGDTTASLTKLWRDGDQVGVADTTGIWIYTGGRYWGQRSQQLGHYLVLVHEYFHILQTQLAGNHDRGPDWLIEGSAQVFENLFYGTQPGADLTRVRNNKLPPAKAYKGTLANLESATTFQANFQQAYPMGYLATLYLTDGQGLGDVVSYYRLIGTGVAWRQAFLRTFGMTIDEFYTRFEAYRARDFKDP